MEEGGRRREYLPSLIRQTESKRNIESFGEMFSPLPKFICSLHRVLKRR
jgi:hypothetical protein